MLEPELDTAASDPATFLRINRIEIDLGRVDASALSTDLPARIAAALPRALRRAGGASPDSVRRAPAGRAHRSPTVKEAATIDPISRRLGLVSHFARTGALPWWSDAQLDQPVQQAFGDVLRQAPAALGALVRRLAGDRVSLDRLVVTLNDATIAAILALVVSDASEVSVAGALLTRLGELPAMAGIAPVRLRALFWREMLRAACGSREGTGPFAVWQTGLTSLALETRTTLAELVLISTPVLQARQVCRWKPRRPCDSFWPALKPARVRFLVRHAPRAKGTGSTCCFDG